MSPAVTFFPKKVETSRGSQRSKPIWSSEGARGRKSHGNRKKSQFQKVHLLYVQGVQAQAKRAVGTLFTIRYSRAAPDFFSLGGKRMGLQARAVGRLAAAA